LNCTVKTVILQNKEFEIPRDFLALKQPIAGNGKTGGAYMQDNPAIMRLFGIREGFYRGGAFIIQTQLTPQNICEINLGEFRPRNHRRNGG